MSKELLSIDPGDPSGWALWQHSEAWHLVSFGELADPDGPMIMSLLGRLLPDWTSCELVIEAQWYRDPEPVVKGIRQASGRGKKTMRWQSPKSGRILEVDLAAKRGGAPWTAVAQVVASRARWEAICGVAGMTLHEPVAPGRWIRDTTKGCPERDTHQRIREVTMARWNKRFNRLGYDEAAAILLGEWWLIEQRQRIQRNGAPARGLRGLPEVA